MSAQHTSERWLLAPHANIGMQQIYAPTRDCGAYIAVACDRDAEHIVKCVNAHDDLVEALLAYVQHDMLLNGGRNDVSLRMRNGVAALKKVGAM